MKYIIHKRLKSTTLAGNVNIPYGTELDGTDKIVYYDGKPLCYATSQIFKEHIAKNDDGQGLQRGALTHTIAFKGTDNVKFRFTDKQIEIICTKYQRYIRQDCDYIIFNNRFFSESVGKLQEVADALGIRV